MRLRAAGLRDRVRLPRAVLGILTVWLEFRLLGGCEKDLESSRQQPGQGPQRPGQQSKAGRGMSRGPRRRQ